MNKIIISISDNKNGTCNVKVDYKFKEDAKENVKIASLNVKNIITNSLKQLEKEGN